MTLYEYYNTGDDNHYWIRANWWLAQSFTIGTVGTNEDHYITSVKLKLYRYGSPGTITVSIRNADANGLPTGSDLTSGTLNGNSITTTGPGEWYEITLTQYQLSASTQYTIVVRAPDGNDSNKVAWRFDGSTPTYGGGTGSYSGNSGASWTGISDQDYMFEEYGTTGAAAGRILRPVKYW